MYFRIADTFTDSLAKLTGEEQKAVKTTAFDLQLNPTNPGMRFHKLDRIWKRPTTPNDTCCTLPALVRVTTCLSPVSHRRRSFWMICRNSDVPIHSTPLAHQS